MNKVTRNQLSVIKNPYQGKDRRVLTVCSGGVLRSPTAATMMTTLFGYNTRSCGTEDYALIPLTPALILWAQEIVCAEQHHANVVMDAINNHYDLEDARPLVYVLGIQDDYDYMDGELQQLIHSKFDEWGFK